MENVETPEERKAGEDAAARLLATARPSLDEVLNNPAVLAAYQTLIDCGLMRVIQGIS